MTAAFPRPFDATPAALVEHGTFRFGTYASAIPTVNPLDAIWAPYRPFQSFRLKEWQAFQAGDADVFLLGAVYVTKLLDLLQVVVIEKRSGRVHKWEERVLPFRLAIAQGLNGTRSAGSSGGLSVRFDNRIPQGTLSVTADAVATGERPELSLRLRGRCGPGEAGHLVICHPFSDDRALYSHKCLMPADGSVRFGSEGHTLRDGDGFLILDDHKGFYPSPMQYDWLTAAWRDPDGRLLGFNLTANQIRDPDVYNENALWIGAEVERLPAVGFARPAGVYGRWRIVDKEGRVDVRFEPVVRNEVHAGPWSALVDYYGPFGWVEGTITRASGERVVIAGAYGMGEQKFIRL